MVAHVTAAWEPENTRFRNHHYSGSERYRSVCVNTDSSLSGRSVVVRFIYS
jgi:hypothetical protein